MPLPGCAADYAVQILSFTHPFKVGFRFTVQGGGWLSGFFNPAFCPVQVFIINIADRGNLHTLYPQGGVKMVGAPVANSHKTEADWPVRWRRPG